MSRKENTLSRLLSLKTRNNIKRVLAHLGGGMNSLWTANPTLAAKMFPMRPSSGEYIVLDRSEAAYGKLDTDSQGVPIPPLELRIGESSPEFFLSSGLQDVETMWRVLGESGCVVAENARILEFGCSAGRQLRHLRRRLDEGEVWGVDLSTEHIFWIQQHLDKRFRVLAVSSDAHLPFRDGFFDFIYAGSVFTHLDDLADAWFLELSRVVRKGGLLYLTILDESSIEWLRSHQDSVPLAELVLTSKSCQKFLTSKACSFSIGRSLHAYVFYNSAWLVDHLSKYFDVVTRVTGDFRGLQSAIVLRNSK
jgi:SAM-dependent methyltransferase